MKGKDVTGGLIYQLSAGWGNEIKNVTEGTRKSMEKIFVFLHEKFFFNHCHDQLSFWIKDTKGPYEFFRAACGEESDEEDVKEIFDATPEVVWYKATFAYYEEGRAVKVGSFLVSLQSEDENYFPQEYAWFFDYLYRKVKEVAKKVEEGTYLPELEKELPYQDRYGLILKKELWKIDPRFKRWNNKGISAQLFREFKQACAAPKPPAPMQNMTFDFYFEMAIEGYRRLGYEIDEKKSLFENFERYGEDFGSDSLETCPHDALEGFEHYLNDLAYELGGHPWGILMGSSRTRVGLFPKKSQDGYVFVLSGNPVWMAKELMTFAIAFSEKGYPVVLEDGLYESLVNYYTGDEYLGFVPWDVFPVYQSESFSLPVEDFTHLKEGEEGLISHIHWNPLKREILRQDWVELDLKEKNYSALSNDMDRASRFAGGQYRLAFGWSMSEKQFQDVDILHVMFTGLRVNAYFGIFSERICLDAKRFWDLHQLLRYEIFWRHNDPNDPHSSMFVAGDPYSPSSDIKKKDFVISGEGEDYHIKARAWLVEELVRGVRVVYTMSVGDEKKLWALFQRYCYVKNLDENLAREFVKDLCFRDQETVTECVNLYSVLEKARLVEGEAQ